MPDIGLVIPEISVEFDKENKTILLGKSIQIILRICFELLFFTKFVNNLHASTDMCNIYILLCYTTLQRREKIK